MAGGGGFGGGFSNMSDIFEQHGDIFGDIFGSAFGRQNSGRRVTRGSNLRIKIKLSLKEIHEGTVKKIKIKRLVPDPETKFKNCSYCNGTGKITKVANTILGQMQTTSVCHYCQGSGKIVTSKSRNANSNGMISMEELTEISIPAGVSEGMQLKVKEKGNHAPFGGIPGDLLVLIEEESHTELIREGKIFILIYISVFSDAVIGCQVEIPTINGKAKINIQKWCSKWQNTPTKIKGSE